MALFDFDPEPVEMRGNALVCPVCFNKKFWKREAQLNTPMATFFNLDWTNKTATCYVCSDCSHIMWFLYEK